MNYFFVDYENVKNSGLEGIEMLAEDDTVIIFYSQNANTITFETHKKLCAAKANIVFERVNVGHKNALDFQLASYVGYIMGKTEDYETSYHLVTNDAAFSVISRFWSRKEKICSVIERISDVTDNPSTMPAIPQNAEKRQPRQKNEDIGSKTEIAEVSEDINIFDEAAVSKERYEAPEILVETESEDMVKIAEVTLIDIPEPANKKRGRKPKTQNRAKNKETLDFELEKKLESVLSDKNDIPVIVKIIKQYKTKMGINNALMKQFPSQNNQRSGEIYQAIKPLLTDKKGK